MTTFQAVKFLDESDYVEFDVIDYRLARDDDASLGYVFTGIEIKIRSINLNSICIPVNLAGAAGTAMESSLQRLARTIEGDILRGAFDTDYIIRGIVDRGLHREPGVLMDEDEDDPEYEDEGGINDDDEDEDEPADELTDEELAVLFRVAAKPAPQPEPEF